MGKFANLLKEDTPQENKYSEKLLPAYEMGHGGTPIRGMAQGNAGFKANFLSSIPEDEGTRLRVAAERIYPNDPKAVERFSFGPTGTIVENIPDEKNPGQTIPVDIGAGPSGFLGRVLAYAPEAIGSGIGALYGGPVGSGLGGAAGKSVKQIGANLFMDEPQTAKGNALGLAKEAAIDTAFTALGAGANKVLSARAVKELADVDVKAAEKMIQQAKDRHGITLSLAQVTNNPRLKAMYRYLSNHPGEASEVMQAFQETQRGQVNEAITRVLNSVTSPKSAGDYGAPNAATAAIDLAKLNRSNAAQPFYDAAFKEAPPVDAKPVVALIDEKLKTAKGPIAKYLKSAKSFLYSGKELDSSIQGLHQSKLAIDNLLEGQGSNSVGNVARRELVQVKEQLVKQLSDASPAYKRGMEVFAQHSKQSVEPLQNSVLGMISNLPTYQSSRAAGMLFNGQAPDINSIRFAREHIQDLGKKNDQFIGAWDGLVRQYLEQQFNKAGKLTTTGPQPNVAGRFRALVAGTPQQDAALLEMLGREKYGIMKSVLDDLEMVARTPVQSSQTTFNQTIKEQLTGAGSSRLRALREPIQTAMAKRDASVLERNATNLAQALTDPSKLALLKKLQGISKSSERAILISAVISGQAIPETMERYLEAH